MRWNFLPASCIDVHPARPTRTWPKHVQARHEQDHAWHNRFFARAMSDQVTGLELCPSMARTGRDRARLTRQPVGLSQVLPPLAWHAIKL
jgi:hypothetical protein